jgi:hypothetical protein
MLRLMRLINEWAAGDGRPDQNWAISPIGLRALLSANWLPPLGAWCAERGLTPSAGGW